MQHPSPTRSSPGMLYNHTHALSGITNKVIRPYHYSTVNKNPNHAIMIEQFM